MSQQSKPAAYLKAAAKALRLQRTLSRSKSSKSKDIAASAAMSAPCSPSTPTFQHSNGRRLSYSQYIQHPQGAYSIQLHTPHHHQYIPDLHYDTPLYSLQRRRNNSHSTSRQRSCSPGSSRPAAVDSTIYSKGTAHSKLSHRSGPPVGFPVITIHHMQPDHTNSSGTYVTLTRSKSMPLRRRKRFSHQPPTVPMPSMAPVVSHSQWSTSNPSPVSTQHSEHRTLGTVPPTKPVTALNQRIGSTELAATTRPDTGGLEQLVLNLDLCIPGPTVSDSQFRSSCSSSSTTTVTAPVGSAAPVPGIGHNTICRTRSGQNMSIASAIPKPSRSLTGSSLISSKSTQSMPLADSSMSIQSHLSEASMLSAAMSASGLPSMDVMMDQVDRSIAADRQAQLVENAHVSVPHVTYVNRSMLVEPCSAKVETWVN